MSKAKSQVETFRGRRNTVACKVALGFFFLGWLSIGWLLDEMFGRIGWLFFAVASIGLYWMPVIYIVELEPDREANHD